MFTFCICAVNMHKIIAYVCKLFMQCAKISRYCKLWYVTASITNYTFQQKPNAMQIFDIFIFECVNQKTHVKLYFGLVWGYWKRFYVGCIIMMMHLDEFVFWLNLFFVHRFGAWWLGNMEWMDTMFYHMCWRHKESISCLRFASTEVWCDVLWGKWHNL